MTSKIPATHVAFESLTKRFSYAQEKEIKQPHPTRSGYGCPSCFAYNFGQAKNNHQTISFQPMLLLDSLDHLFVCNIAAQIFTNDLFNIRCQNTATKRSSSLDLLNDDIRVISVNNTLCHRKHHLRKIENSPAPNPGRGRLYEINAGTRRPRSSRPSCST